MPTLIFGILILVIALWVLGVISKVDPKMGARVLKASGGIIALGLAVFLGLRGEIWLAIPLGATGLGLLGWMPFGPAGFSARTTQSGGKISRVSSAFFEMELDHDSGEMRGRVIA
ncbi:MAG: molecular chaperone DnaJ, partial [Pseudolabrys sp.]